MLCVSVSACLLSGWCVGDCCLLSCCGHIPLAQFAVGRQCIGHAMGLLGVVAKACSPTCLPKVWGKQSCFVSLSWPVANTGMIPTMACHTQAFWTTHMLVSLFVFLSFYLSVCLCSVCLCLPVCFLFGVWGIVACYPVVGTSLLPNLLLEDDALGMQWSCLVFPSL